MGVPYLRIKKLKKIDLPPLKRGNNTDRERNFCNTYSNFSLNKKNKRLILSNNLRKSSDKIRTKKIFEDEDKKIKTYNETNEISQNSEEKNDNIEMPKVKDEDNNNRMNNEENEEN